MYFALTATESREAERRAIAEAGFTVSGLMSAAGEALADTVLQRVPEGAIAVVAGPGNNGGDGWVAARVLHAAGREVHVFSLRAPSELPSPAGAAADEAISAGVRWTRCDDPPSLESFAGVIDALLGIGTSGELRPPMGGWVEAVNESQAFVVSADVPTGVDSDTGVIALVAVRADVTVTFTSIKRGLLVYPGAEYAGEIQRADLGIPEMLDHADYAPEVWTSDEYAALVYRPALDVHKNARGRVLIVAGSTSYPGAAVLAAMGAARSGAGYVTLAVPQGIVSIAQGHLLAQPVVGMPHGRTGAFSSAALERILRLAREFDAVVLGPGMTLADGAVVTARGLVAELPVPLVLDADGLNALVDARGILESRRAPTVLTPHPGELGRLLGTSTASVQADRLAAGAELAQSDRVVVLKGAGTITSGGGRQVINTTGTPALATAGTGDVLAGIVGGLLAQGIAPLDAGALAAFVHGRAGEVAAAHLTPVCVTATDVVDHLPAAFSEMLGEW